MQSTLRLYGPVLTRLRAIPNIVPDAAQVRAAMIMDEALDLIIAASSIRKPMATPMVPKEALMGSDIESVAEHLKKLRLLQKQRLMGSDFESVAEYTRRLSVENKRLLANQGRNKPIEQVRVQGKSNLMGSDFESVAEYTTKLAIENKKLLAMQKKEASKVEQYTKVQVRLEGEAGEDALGIYLFGRVGRGKTMLFDIFFSEVSSRLPRVDRLHYSEFMKRVHQGSCPEPRVLFLDELAIPDVQDAAIFPKKLAELISKGTIMVITSNQHPQSLYSNGLNRNYFISPLLRNLKIACKLVSLDGETDFRLNTTREGWSFTTSLGPSTPTHCEHIKLSKSRSIVIPLPRCPLDTLIKSDLSESDYIEIFSKIKTIEIEISNPFSAKDILNRFRRFCKLVEILYDRSDINVLFVSSVGVDALFANIGLGSRELIGNGVLGETADAGASPLAAAAVDEGMRSLVRVISRLKQAVLASST